MPAGFGLGLGDPLLCHLCRGVQDRVPCLLDPGFPLAPDLGFGIGLAHFTPPSTELKSHLSQAQWDQVLPLLSPLPFSCSPSLDQTTGLLQHCPTAWFT